MMKSAPIGLDDFKTSLFYERLLEVTAHNLLGMTQIKSMFKLIFFPIKASKLGYYISNYLADPQFEPKLMDVYNKQIT